MDTDLPYQDRARGYIPRDFASFPLGSSPYTKKFDKKLIPRKEWKERGEFLVQKGRDPLSVAISKNAMPTFQNGFGYCWMHAAVMGMKVAIAQAGWLAPRLSATAGACKIKNYRNRGGNAYEAFPFLAEHGCPTVEFWAENDNSRSNDNASMQENAQLHRIIEHYELDPNSDEQKATALLMGYSLWSGYSNIGHAMLSARYVEDGRGNPGCLDINSWSRDAANATQWNLSWLNKKDVIWPRYGRDFRSFECYAVRVITYAEK